MGFRITVACALVSLALAGCSGHATAGSDGGLIDETTITNDGGDSDAGEPDLTDSGVSDAGDNDAGATDSGTPDAGPPCTTTITYGNSWLHPINHPSDTDTISGNITWDGACTDDGANSYALLSNGWKPYFSGHGTCVIALDTNGCGTAPSCATRVTYGPAWQHPTNHPDQFDDVSSRLLWDGSCTSSGANSYATLSNGWSPNFTGANACELGLRYTGCGGLYANPVLPTDCADPGVLRDGARYVLTCTSGNATNAFPIFTSSDLIHWTAAGHIFPSAKKPAWATGDFWAPEIHKVGSKYVAYFSARHTDGKLSVGAASANSALGPFTDVGAPLVHDASLGVIDVNEFEDAQGQPYLVWKVDGNAVGQPTPIYGQPLSSDGLTRTGSAVQLVTNDLAWEGSVTEGPFVIRRGTSYFLFYSGNAYYNSTYAVGVARASNPLGPYTKFGAPIVTTSAAWIGPGHCSVVPGPSGDDALVYHAWVPGQVNTPGSGRKLLVDTLDYANGWPRALDAPSATSQPLP